MKKILLFITSLIASFSFATNNLNSALLKDVNTGSIKSLTSYKGKKYIKLWASWCPVCLHSLPHTLELANEKNLDFKVITIVSPNSIGELPLDSFKKWWSSLPEYKDIPVLADEKGYIVNKVKLRGYPTNIFLDSKGEIVRVVPGLLNNSQIKSIFKNIK